MKRSIFIHLLLFIAIASFILPCGCNKNPAPVIQYPQLPVVSIPEPAEQLLEESGTYTNTDYHFTLRYCQEFDMVENYQGVIVGFLGDLLSGMTQYISIFVAAEELPEKTTLRDYLSKNMQYGEEKLRDYSIVSEEETTIDGITAVKIVYTFSATLGDNDIDFQNALTSFVKDDMVYTIKLSVPERYYQKNRPCYELVLYTFKFE
ncbi:MAG: hypothetical protein P8105_01435 [Dehalococcoidia bacterium]